MANAPDIQAIGTPNPKSVKFLTDRTLLARGSADFRDPESTQRSPLARRLFDVDGVVGVFLCQNFVTVTVDDESRWKEIAPVVTESIRDFLVSGEEILHPEEPSSPAEDGDAVVAQIRNILDTQIRPQVANDGGDVVFVSFDRGVVRLSMQGACGGCPSATMTLKHGIEARLRHFVPQVERVEAV